MTLKWRGRRAGCSVGPMFSEHEYVNSRTKIFLILPGGIWHLKHTDTPIYSRAGDIFCRSFSTSFFQSAPQKSPYRSIVGGESSIRQKKSITLFFFQNLMITRWGTCSKHNSSPLESGVKRESAINTSSGSHRVRADKDRWSWTSCEEQGASYCDYYWNI